MVEEVSFVPKLCMYLCAQLVSSVWLCNPIDCSLPGSSVHGILQARILEWVSISFSRGSSQPVSISFTPCKRVLFWALLWVSVWFSASKSNKNIYICMRVIILPPFGSYLYLFMAMLGFRCFCVSFLYLWQLGLLFVMVHRLLIAMASLVEEHGL